MKGLYIHIPFCIKKCNYCDFASYPSCISRADEYINALNGEMKKYEGEDINTVYFGGGTPSLLKSEQIGSVINSVFSKFNVSTDAEITIEINPCTVNKEKARQLKEMGFERIEQFTYHV